MKLPEPRWGRGMENIDDEEALGAIFLLIAQMKSPKYLTHVIAAAGVSLSSLLGIPLQNVIDSVRAAIDDWDEVEVAERRAMLMSTADQMEASYADFKERLYKEGVEPYEGDDEPPTVQPD